MGIGSSVRRSCTVKKTVTRALYAQVTSVGALVHKLPSAVEAIRSEQRSCPRRLESYNKAKQTRPCAPNMEGTRRHRVRSNLPSTGCSGTAFYSVRLCRTCDTFRGWELDESCWKARRLCFQAGWQKGELLLVPSEKHSNTRIGMRYGNSSSRTLLGL